MATPKTKTVKTAKTTKVPQDHKPKNGPREVTVDGVTITVDPAVFNDFEFMDALDQVDQGNPLRVATAMRLLVGDDQVKAVMDGLRDEETGRVPADGAAAFFAAVMQEMAPNS